MLKSLFTPGEFNTSHVLTRAMDTHMNPGVLIMPGEPNVAVKEKPNVISTLISLQNHREVFLPFTRAIMLQI